MEPARDFTQLHLHFVDQIQWRYELIRPLVLLAEGTASQRAQETHTHPDTVRTFVRRFRQQGMLGLLPGSIEVVPRGRAFITANWPAFSSRRWATGSITKQSNSSGNKVL